MKSKTKWKQLLLVLFVFTFSTAIVFGQNCGDINENESIDIIDALLVAQCFVGLISCPSADIGDVNCDGVIDILDALLIAQLFVGLINTLDCCETPTVPPGVNLEMQAEDASWSDGAVESDHSGYTGSGYVITANSEGVWIEWTIDVDRDCSATCVFRYAVSGSNRPMDLSVNGNVQASLSFPDTGAWTTWNTETGDINLSEGSNAIRLTAANSNGAPNMDKMDITIFSGIVVTPTPDPVTPTPIPVTPTPSPTPIPGCTPQINSLTPNKGTQGSYIKINGTCFGTGTWATVHIGDWKVLVLSWTDTEINVEITHAQSSGVYDVIITPYEETGYVFPQLFEYVSPELNVTEVITAHAGDQLNLTGRYFGSAYSKFNIYFRPQTDINTSYLAQTDSWHMDPVSGDSTCVFTIPDTIPTGEYFIQGRNLIDWSELYDGFIIIE